VGIAERTLSEIHSWPPGLPVFGQLTPFPQRRFTIAWQRPDGSHDLRTGWTSHLSGWPTPRSKMTIEDARRETDRAWRASYSPKRNAQAIDSIRDAPFKNRVSHLVSRLFFRGIYFPQTTKWAWVRVIFENRRAIFNLAKEGLVAMRTQDGKKTGKRVE
jgi:hypothetical protein